MHIRKGDLVEVVSGDDSGTRGPVMSVDRKNGRVVIEGVNKVYKHVKRGHPKSPQGGRLRMEMPISGSNVQYYCEACKKLSGLGVRYLVNGAKERFCKKCTGSAGVMSPPRAAYAKK